MAFTDKLIQNLQAKAKPYREWEGASDPGFGVQVTPNGVKSFYLFYRFNNKRRFMTLGRYPNTTLASARDMARSAHALLDKGIDPQDHHKAEIEKRTEEKNLALKKKRDDELKGSLQQLAEQYIKQLRFDGKRSANEVERALKQNVLQVLDSGLKACEIKPHHIKIVLHKIIERGSLIQANRVRSYLSAMFRYGIEHDNDPKNLKANLLFFIEINPVRDVPKPQKREKAGERDLSMEEMRQLWHLLDTSKMSLQTQIALKLILATGGQRVKEVLWASWKEFDLNRCLWEIPASRTKNGRAHVVPLAEMALNLLSELKKISGNTDYLFPKYMNNVRFHEAEEPYMPLTSLNRAIVRLCQQTEFAKFNPRDLRRTCKTRMGEMGLSKEVRDRLHNHALDDVSSKHYDRYDYLREKTIAMNSWDGKIKQIVLGYDAPSDKVVSIVNF